MCEEAKGLINAYLDVLEEYDRVHLMLLAAYRRNDPEALGVYRSLLDEAKFKLHAAAARFREHQQTHNCSEVIRLEDDFAGNF